MFRGKETAINYIEQNTFSKEEPKFLFTTKEKH
jgi:hypothetical protein